ncbi:MAG: carboxypeptidase-like regulatory domain-containing protein [Eudoraea sp.]|nr:carboxypeptidase-like regulatory domain-containing protein [Eudoraea sp.]
MLLAQTVTAILVDGKSNKPIPYATVQYGTNEGVIANEEGLFSIDLDKVKMPLDSIYITSMGYEKLGISYDAVIDSIVYIKPKAIKLSEVYLFDNPLTVKEIIEKVQQRMPYNYNKEPVRQRFFLRQSSLNSIQKFDVDFKKSTIKELNKELLDSVWSLIPKNSAYYTETLGDYYKKENGQKLSIVKAAELYDKKNEDSFESLGERMEKIFKDNVKQDSYLKIKSGLFGTKVQLDSIIEENEEAGGVKVEIAEEGADQKNYFLDSRKGVLDDLEQELFFQEDAKLNVLQKPRKYRFKIEGYADIQDEGVYVISFEPKGGADFEGTLFVNIEDYAVVRLEYKNVKLLRNFKLLGFMYQEHLFSGSTLFERTDNGTYELKFQESVIGRKMGVDRPLKVIEKNKNVKGRRKQNELSLGIDVVNFYTEKFEYVVFDSDIIPDANFTSAKENHEVKATYMTRYDPEFWAGYTIMEPNQAIRDFKVLGE